jgi:hypothetical protein
VALAGRAFVSEKIANEDHWVLWWHAAGDEDGVPFHIRHWNDVNRIALDVGFDPGIVLWTGDSQIQMMRAVGAPPHGAAEPSTHWGPR